MEFLIAILFPKFSLYCLGPVTRLWLDYVFRHQEPMTLEKTANRYRFRNSAGINYVFAKVDAADRKRTWKDRVDVVKDSSSNRGPTI